MDRSETAAALARLSEKHIQVLAMVARHRLAKEIAWELGISEDTVAQRMKRVQTLLGVSSRAEAARIFLEADHALLSDSAVYDTVGLANRSSITDEVVSLGTGAGTGGKAELRQPTAAYSTAFVGWPDKTPWYARLLEAGPQNNLSLTARTMIIASLSLLAILSAAAAVALAEGLSRVF